MDEKEILQSTNSIRSILQESFTGIELFHQPAHAWKEHPHTTQKPQEIKILMAVILTSAEEKLLIARVYCTRSGNGSSKVVARRFQKYFLLIGPLQLLQQGTEYARKLRYRNQC
jgi:hypothetical protein